MAVMEYSGAWGKLIHEKNRSRKSRDTVPLNGFCSSCDSVPLKWDPAEWLGKNLFYKIEG